MTLRLVFIRPILLPLFLTAAVALADESPSPHYACSLRTVDDIFIHQLTENNLTAMLNMGGLGVEISPDLSTPDYGKRCSDEALQKIHIPITYKCKFCLTKKIDYKLRISGEIILGPPVVSFDSCSSYDRGKLEELSAPNQTNPLYREYARCLAKFNEDNLGNSMGRLESFCITRSEDREKFCGEGWARYNVSYSVSKNGHPLSTQLFCEHTAFGGAGFSKFSSVNALAIEKRVRFGRNSEPLYDCQQLENLRRQKRPSKTMKGQGVSG